MTAKLLAAFGDPPPSDAIKFAADALHAGAIVAIPTDTAYGLAADPFGTGAVDRLFSAKRRPRDVELPVLVANRDAVDELAESVPEAATRLMDVYWPGALTLVLPRRANLNADLGSDDATVGVRCPDHPVPLALCKTVGPLATTSANLHGQPTPDTAQEVAEIFADQVAVVLDAGTRTGSPSTVVDCTGPEPKLLREGQIPWGDVQRTAAGD